MCGIRGAMGDAIGGVPHAPMPCPWCICALSISRSVHQERRPRVYLMWVVMCQLAIAYLSLPFLSVCSWPTLLLFVSPSIRLHFFFSFLPILPFLLLHTSFSDSASSISTLPSLLQCTSPMSQRSAFGTYSVSSTRQTNTACCSPVASCSSESCRGSIDRPFRPSSPLMAGTSTRRSPLLPLLLPIPHISGKQHQYQPQS